jgi:hypothetical protein
VVTASPIYSVACLLKSRIVKPAETVVTRQQLNNRQMLASRDTQVTIEELSKNAFSARSVPSLYNEDQLPLRENPEMVVRGVEGWCEMAARLQGREPGSRVTSTVGRRYQAEQ